jgi:hypothetical protein
MRRLPKENGRVPAIPVVRRAVRFSQGRDSQLSMTSQPEQIGHPHTYDSERVEDA